MRFFFICTGDHRYLHVLTHSFPTRRSSDLLNTLYVTTEGAGLRKDGENLVAEVEGQERARVPLHMLASVVVFGGIYLSPPLIQACAAGGITIVLLDRNGRSEEHTSELQSLMRISYAVFCLKQKTNKTHNYLSQQHNDDN